MTDRLINSIFIVLVNIYIAGTYNEDIRLGHFISCFTIMLVIFKLLLFRAAPTTGCYNGEYISYNGKAVYT